MGSPGSSLPLSVPIHLLPTLLFLSFYLHLLVVNFLLGGGVIAFGNDWYAHRRRAVRHRHLAEGLIRAMPVALILSLVSGLAPLLFLQLLHSQTGTAPPGAGWRWLLALILMIVGFSGWYAVPRFRLRWGRRVLGVEGGSCLSLALVALLCGGPGLSPPPSGLFSFPDPSLLSRWLHLLVGATAFAGLYIALYGLWCMHRGRVGDGYWVFRQGLGWFLIMTLVQFTVGTWLLSSLPERFDFLGLHPHRTSLLVAGIVCSLAGFIGLMASRTAFRPTPWAGAGAFLMFVAAGIMVLVRDTLRQGRPEGLLPAQAAGVTLQWSSVCFFLVVLSLGIITLTYLLWLSFRLPFRPRLEES